MTTEQRMHSTLWATLAWALLLTGCATTSRGLRLPAPTVSPYDASHGDVVWAVAPPRNESGVSVVDPLAVADELASAVGEVRGLAAVPVNRTLAAMRTLGIDGVASGADARRLALTLGVDGVLVGTVTAWDPYDPPRLGLSLALYARPGSDRIADASAEIDPRALTAAATEPRLPAGRPAEAPLSAVSEHLDARNHEVLMDLRAFAEGRHDPDSALGWRGYTASMTLFTRYASHRLVGALLDLERLRLARERATARAPGP